MRKSFVLLLFMANEIFAQQEIFSASVGIDKLKDIAGVEADGYLIIKGETNQNGTLFNVITPQRQQFISSIGIQSLNIVGHSSSNEEITIYFTFTPIPEVGSVHCLTFSKIDNRPPSFKNLREKNEMVFLSYISDQQDFYQLRFDSERKLLWLNKYSKEIKVDSSAIEITDPELVRKIKGAKSFFAAEQNQNSKPVFIPDNSEIPFELAMNQRKMYFRRNRLWLVMDKFGKDKDFATLICEFDFTTGTFKQSTLPLTAEPKVDYNSFLFKDTLFVLSIDKHYMNIDVFDFQTLNKIKRIVYVRGERIDFKKSFLIKNDEVVDKDWDGKWSDRLNSNYTFRFLNGGVPVISVSSDSSNYRFLIGNHEIPKTSWGGGFMSVGGGSISTPGGTVPGPVSYVPTGRAGGRLESKTYFYGYLSKSDFTVPDEKFKSHGKFDKIKNRLEKLGSEIKIGGKCIINTKDKTYLAYINKKTMYMHIEEY